MNGGCDIRCLRPLGCTICWPPHLCPNPVVAHSLCLKRPQSDIVCLTPVRCTAAFPNQVVALGNGSQVVVAANPTSKIVMLGFSASNATLALMLQTVTTLEPVAFLNTMFQGGPPAVSPFPSLL